MSRWQKFKLWFNGDYFEALCHHDTMNLWGVYHRWRHVGAGYNLTQQEAERRAAILNQALLDNKDVYAIKFI